MVLRPTDVRSVYLTTSGVVKLGVSGVGGVPCPPERVTFSVTLRSDGGVGEDRRDVSTVRTVVVCTDVGRLSIKRLSGQETVWWCFNGLGWCGLTRV